MKVLVTKEIGFCFGVKRAINLTEQKLSEKKKALILGDLVHNPAVTEKLEARGLQRINSLDQERQGTLVIRAHGLPAAMIDQARSQGLEVVDATCPTVRHAQRAAQSLERTGCQVIIIGDEHHAEIKGILGSLKRPALVVNSVEALHQAKVENKVGVMFQTTQSLEICQPIIDELLPRVRELHMINTVCVRVQRRQQEAAQLAASVDVMVVVGALISANSRKLHALCQRYNPRTLLVESADQINPDDFRNARTAGITAGLSTPLDLVESVRTRLEELPENG